MSRRRARRLALGLALACAGCSLAPEYKVPDTPEVTAYRADPAWQPAAPADRQARGQWWTLFGDPQLNALEDDLMQSSFTLEAAYARYQQSNALAQIARAGLIRPRRRRSAHAQPPVRQPPAAWPTSPSLYTDAPLAANVSYEIDLWGRVRNSVAAAQARAEAAGDDYESVRLGLSANLANTIPPRGLDSNIALLAETEAAYQRAVELTDSRYQGGVACRSDVDQALTQLETARALRIDANLRREQLQNARLR